MNPIETSCQPSQEATDEPLKLSEALGATAIVVGACAAVAIAFTTLAAAHVTRDAFKLLFRKGGSRVQ